MIRMKFPVAIAAVGIGAGWSSTQGYLRIATGVAAMLFSIAFAPRYS